MPITPIQNSFTLGETDPDLLARADIGLFTKSARRLRNMIPLWTGGARIGPGTLTATEGGNPFVLVDRTNANAPITNEDLFKKFTYTYSAVDNEIYDIVLRTDTTNGTAFEIFDDNDHVATVNLNIAAVNVWQAAWIPEIEMAQRENECIFFYNARQPLRLRRGATSATWVISWWQPNYYPTFDFSTVDAATTNYRVAGFTFTPAATTGAGINLTASAAVFNDNHVGGLFQSIGANAGLGRIVSISSTTVAQIDIISNFSAAAAIKGSNCSLREVMFSPSISNPPAVVVAGTDRGWPGIGAFYNDRLVVGKTETLPNVIAFTETNSATNFNDEDFDAARGFSSTITEGLQDIVADDSLLFLGVKKNYGLNTLVENPLNPANFTAPPQSQDSTGMVRAVTVDNQILHATIDGDKVNRVTYSTADAKYIATPATILADHLVTDVKSNSAFLPNNVTAKLYMATQADGTLLIYNTLLSEGVNGWSLHTTRGDFFNVSGALDLCSVLVRRQIGTGATVTGSVDYCFKANPAFTAFLDITTEINAAGTNIVMFENDEEYVIVGNDVPFTRIAWTLNTNASADIDITVEYLDNNQQWTPFTITDGTTGFTGNGTMSWALTDVAGWSPNTVWETENAYWIRIRRNIDALVTAPIEQQAQLNVADRVNLERFSFNDYMHAQFTATSDAAGQVTGLTHLAGQEVYIINGNQTQGPYFVDSTGVVELTLKNASTEFKIGAFFKPLLRPMPVLTETQEGINVYQERHILKTYLDYVDSLYLTIEDEDVPMIDVNGYTLGYVVPPQTGVYELAPSKGWQPRIDIDISQSKPGPMTIIGVGYEVEVS